MRHKVAVVVREPFRSPPWPTALLLLNHRRMKTYAI